MSFRRRNDSGAGDESNSRSAVDAVNSHEMFSSLTKITPQNNGDSTCPSSSLRFDVRATAGVSVSL